MIRIDLDPAISAGFIHDRFDLLVYGRVVSDKLIDEIAVQVDGAACGRMQYGQPGKAAQVDLPGDGGDLHYVFRITVPLQRAQAHRVCSCVIAVRAQDGATHAESFDLSVDPSKAVPVSVTSGPTCSSQTYADVRPPLVLYVERAALDESGQLLVQGWAVSQASLVTVQVFLEEEQVGAAQLGRRRDDVGTAFPDFPNARRSGFSLSKGIAAPAEAVAAVRVQAITLDGFLQEEVLPLERTRTLHEKHQIDVPPVPPVSPPAPTMQQAAYRLVAGFQLGPDLLSVLSTPLPFAPPVPPSTPPPTRDPRRVIQFYCDAMNLDADGNLNVVGWAVCAVGISTIVVHLDNEVMGEAELGLLRQDVGDEYRQIPMARHSGFRFDKAVGHVPTGEHRIRVVVRNGLDDVWEESRTLLIERAAPLPAPVIPAGLRLQIDTPAVVDGRAVEPVTGRLTIEGWALAPAGITGIEVLLDDQRLGDAHYGLARQDVGVAFPNWSDSLRSGYAFHCPPRSLRNGDHVVQLNVHTRTGAVLEHRFNVVVRKSEEFGDGITIRRRITQVEADVSDDVLDNLGHRPEFRLILRQESAPDRVPLLATIGSLRTQAYRDWRLEIVASDGDTAAAVRTVIAEAVEDVAERIDVIDPSEPAAFDQPIGSRDVSSTLRLVGFLSAGDRLGADALLRIALASGLHSKADMLYADEARISPVSGEREPFFKPDFSPDLLLSANYIGRPWFASTALLGRCGVTARELLETGEYDVVLRCSEQAAQVHHVPDVLCQRGAPQIDDAEVEAMALSRAASRRGMAAEVLAGAMPGTWRVRRTEPVTGLVSIIMPTCGARGYVETCIKSLRERTAYRNFEIIAVDNIPDSQIAWKVWLQQNADKVVAMPDAFNWSHFNNCGVKAASGEYLLFLNDDIEVISPDWLDALLEQVQRPDVAVVGPQLLYPDNKVQHAGMFLATRGTARHAFRFAAADEPGYFGLALTQRNVIAVTGACMLD